MERQLALLQQFVQACCGAGAEASVHQLMAQTLPQAQRLLGSMLALILAGSGGINRKHGALDLERQDAHGCTLMHYVCALRNSPALQLLLRANVDPHIADTQGLAPADWAKAYRFEEGEALIRQHLGNPAATAAPVPPPYEAEIIALTGGEPGHVQVQFDTLNEEDGSPVKEWHPKSCLRPRPPQV